MKSILSSQKIFQSKRLFNFLPAQRCSFSSSFHTNFPIRSSFNLIARKPNDQNHQNPSTLYLHSLVMLEDYIKLNDDIEDFYILIDASQSGFKKATLLLATISYVENSDNSKYRDYLKEYDENIDWSNDQLVKSTIESYLKELINTLDSKFAHYAIVKFYLKNNEYEKAMEYLTLYASDKMHSKAKYELALLLRSGSPDGKVKKNQSLALQLFTQLISEPQAIKQLVEMYKNGEGTTASYSKAMNQQLEYYFSKFIYFSKIVASMLGMTFFDLIMSALIAISIFFCALHASSVESVEFNIDLTFENKETPNKTFSFKLTDE